MDWQKRFDKLLFQFMAFRVRKEGVSFKTVTKPEFIAAVEEVGGICRQAADEGASHDLIYDSLLSGSLIKLMEQYIADKEVSEVIDHTVRETTIHVDGTKPKPRKIIGYRFEPVYESRKGSITTAAFANCLVTGEVLASMGGPGEWVSPAFAELVKRRGVQMDESKVKEALEK